MDEQNTNPGQQPEDQDPTKRVLNLVQKFKELGIDMNLLMNIMGETAENAVKASVKDLSSQIDMKVGVLGEKLGKQINENVNGLRSDLAPILNAAKQMEAQPQSTALAPAGGGNVEIPPGPGLGAGGMGGGGWQERLFGNIANRMLGSGEPPPNQGLAQVKGTIDALVGLLDPLVDLQGKMRQQVYNEMTVYSKTGGELPWNREDDNGGGRTARLTAPKRPQQPARTVELNQEIDDSPSDYSKEAVEMAKRFKFVPAP